MLKNLNPQQQKAVDHNNGPLLIIAGAGTGKTAVITQRIANIVEKGWAKPSEILALTFTEKATGEMIERVDELLPFSFEEVFISTFHSFCDYVLHQDGFYIGLDTNYTLMSQAQSYIFFRKHLYDISLKRFRTYGNPSGIISDILKHFSRLQDEDVTSEEYLKYAQSIVTSDEATREQKANYLELATVYKEYSEIKIKESRLDFGDLITLTLKLFREKPNILQKYQKRFKYILVDEFQDTNYAQNELVNILLLGLNPTKKNQKEANITVVGDDDQAIYKFRGAAVSNIMKFKETYPDAEKIVLTLNYRSKQQILDSSHELIKNNNPYRLEITENIDKNLISMGEFPKTLEDPVQFITEETGSIEADRVAKEILILTDNQDVVGEDIESIDNVLGIYDSKGQSSLFDYDTTQISDKKNIDQNIKYNFSDIAILVRANDHSEEFVRALKYYGIPYKFSGQRGLYYRSEISPLISFLRLMVDYTKDIEMFNLLKMKVWNLSGREIVELIKTSRFYKVSIFQAIEELWNVRTGDNSYENGINLSKSDKQNYIKQILSSDSINSISNILQIFDSTFEMVKENKSIGEILLMFFKDSGYLNYLTKDETSENVFKVQNISKFFESIKRFEKDNGSTLFEYVDFLNYSIDIGDTPTSENDLLADYNGVNILTVHGAKGLEFPVVFLVNLVSDRFPSRSRKDKIPIPDELIKDKIENIEEKQEHLIEERRLFYVGATRAKERLYLTNAKYYGDAKTKKKTSGFIEELLGRNIVESEKESPNKSLSIPEFAINFSGQDDLVRFNDLSINTTGRMSYTQLTNYERCPKQYRYKYLLGLPGIDNPAQTFGRTVHNTLREFFLKHKNAKEGFEGFNQKPEIKDLKDLYNKNWKSGGFESKKQEMYRKEVGWKALESYIENNYSGNELVLEVEKRIVYRIDDILITGSIDRVDLVEEKNNKKYVEIIDYKTGKVKEKEDIESDMQLLIYALALDNLGLVVNDAKLVFVEHGKEVSVKIDLEGFTSLKERVKNIVGEIKKQNFKPKPNLMMCRMCDYNSICEDAIL